MVDDQKAAIIRVYAYMRTIYHHPDVQAPVAEMCAEAASLLTQAFPFLADAEQAMETLKR
jgi:hypothetical protein